MVPAALLLLLMPAVIVGFAATGYWLSIVLHVRYVSDQRHKTACEHIEKVYKDVSGFNIGAEESEEIRTRGGCPVYGEIVPDSMRVLLEMIQPGHNDVFYDLGSGVGKFPIYVHSVTSVKKSVGIELSLSRHSDAQKALEALKKEGAIDEDAKREVSFVHGDITEVDFSDATLIFMCATCFSDELMEKLTERFLTLKPGLRVITLKKLPEHKRLRLIDDLSLRTTWSEGSNMYFYRLIN